MKKIVVIIPSYNNSKWYERNLLSVVAQDYENFKVIYTDDCSSDGTADLVETFIKKNNQENRIQLIKNSVRLGAMHNLYNMIHTCQDDEIIITLDGDDHLAHSKVLSVVNETYQNPDVWVAWSNYADSKGHPGCSKPIPEHIIKSNGYRHYNWCTSHLRTFSAALVKKIKREDFLQKDGNFYQMAWDLSLLIPCIEMAGERSKFINEILYVYNTENPINDDKVNRNLQIQLEKEIRARPKYTRIW